MSGGVVRSGEALLQLRGEPADVPLPLQAAALAAAVEGEIAGDAGEKGVEIVRRLVGRDAVPRLQIGVVFALLGGLCILHDAKGQALQAGAVLFCGAFDGVLAAGKIQRYDLGILQADHLPFTG